MNLKSALSLGWVSRDGRVIIAARGISTIARSSVALILAFYLDSLGFDLFQIGVFLSVGVAGSAVSALIVSLIAEKVGRRRLLVIFTLMSAASGLALVFVEDIVPLMFISFLGSIGGGVAAGGAVQPLEQASISDTASLEKRTDLFAIYRIVAVGGSALGALAAGLPTLFQSTLGMDEISTYRVMFVSFAVILSVAALLYGMLSPAVEVSHNEQRWTNPLKLPSRRLILTLTSLFSLDHFAGSLFMQSIAAWWFNTRFGLDLASIAPVFALAQVLSATSLWVAAKLSNRIGLINTMVFTHIPASLFLIAAAFSPVSWMAIVFWQLRAFLSMMDVPTRDSYTMSVVQPNERVAMAGIHIVGRSVAGTIGPSLGTVLWQAISASAPLIGSAVLKISYDLSLYFMFRNVKPPQEAEQDSDGVAPS